MTFYLFSYSYEFTNQPETRYMIFDSDGNRLNGYASSIPDIPSLFTTDSWTSTINPQALQFFGSVLSCIQHTNGNRLTYLCEFSTLTDLTTLFPEHFL